MTARSFTEGFGLDAGHFPDDALSASYAITDLQHGCSIPRYREAIDTLAKSVPAIIAQRDSARDWAAALEGQNAAALALHKPGPLLDHYEYGCICGYTDHRWSECEGCGYVLDDEGELDREIHGRTCPTAAALTGGEDA